MITRLLYLLTGLLLMIFTSCQSDSSAANGKQPNYDMLAKSYCECASESIKLNDKMKGFLDSGDSNAFDGMVNDVQVAFDGSIRCATKAKNEQATGVVDKKKLGNALKNGCPQMPPRLTLELLDKVK